MKISRVFRIVVYAFNLLLVASFANAERLEFDEAESFSEGLAAVRIGGIHLFADCIDDLCNLVHIAIVSHPDFTYGAAPITGLIGHR